MDKEKTVKEITNLIEFNQEKIDLLAADSPALFTAFSGLLNAVSKKYGSGEVVLQDNPTTEVKTGKWLVTIKANGEILSEWLTKENAEDSVKRLEQSDKQSNIKEKGLYKIVFEPAPKELWYVLLSKTGVVLSEQLSLSAASSVLAGMEAEDLGKGRYVKDKYKIVNGNNLDAPAVDAEKGTNGALPEPLKILARRNQVLQGMAIDDSMYLAGGDNFNWSYSMEGNDFWTEVATGNYAPASPTVSWEKTELAAPASVLQYEILTRYWNRGNKLVENLPAPIQISAETIIKKQKKYLSSAQILKTSVFNAFDTANTAEGGNYWEAIFKGDFAAYYDGERYKQYKEDRASNTAKKATPPATPAVAIDLTNSRSYTTWTEDWKSKKMRPAPTRSAAASSLGDTGVGNDGRLYTVQADKNGTQRWVAIKTPPSEYVRSNNAFLLTVEDLANLVAMYDSERKAYIKEKMTDRDEYQEIKDNLIFAQRAMDKLLMNP